MDNTKLIAEARQYVGALMSSPGALIALDMADALEAAEAELTRRDTIQALHDEGDRVVLSSAIGAVVWNASNHPKPSAVLGRDISPLREKLVDAVIAAGFTRSAPVSLEAVKAETTTEWGVRWISLPTPAVTDRGAAEADVRRLVDAHPFISEAVVREVTEWRPVKSKEADGV